MKGSIFNYQIWALVLAGTLLASATSVCAQKQGRSRATRAPAKTQLPAQPDAAYDEAVKLGDQAREAGRLDEAVQQYAKALKIRPKWADGWWYVGAIFYEQDRFSDARDSFGNVVALEPNRGPALGMLGLCEFQTREYDRAIISLQRGRTIGLSDNRELESVVRYHTALLYIRFEQFEIAYDILAEFLLVGNNSPKVVEAFGLAILRMPFLASELPPDKREQVLIAGQAGFNMAARRPDEARAAFDQLLKLYPNAPNVHYAFGVFLMNQDADAALKEFQRELQISPEHQPSMVQMAFEYLKRDDYEKALPLAEKSVQLAPKMFPARNVLGRVLLELGQLDRAIKELEEGTRLAPNSPEMHYALGRAYRRAGREADAKREVALFQKLQDQFNARRNAQLTGGEPDNNQPQGKALNLGYAVRFKAESDFTPTHNCKNAHDEMKNGVRKNTLRLGIGVLCLLILGVGSWASSRFVSPQNPRTRWHPRRVPPNTEFVGDQVCAECHKELVARQSQSAMGIAMEPVGNSKVLVENPLMTFRTGPYAYEIKRQGKESIYSVTDGKETLSLPIRYAFGQGKAGQTYMLQYDGAYYESLVSFYGEIKGLDFTIGAPRTVPESLTKAMGRRLSDNEVGNCFGCHSTGGISGGHVNPAKMTPGIRCEACHGPGGQHDAAVHAGELKAKLIYNPNQLSGDELSQDFCASCHRGNDEFGLLKSMEINNVRFQPYRVFHSKCYSDDRRISCTACHNPHEPLQREVRYYDAKCLACHAPKGQLVDTKTKPTGQSLTVGCKVATKDCVSCHMPKIGPPAAHFKFTDHYIRIVGSKEAYPN